MRLLYRIAGLFRSWFRSDRVDADLADEMHFHVERETEANIARGMAPDVARRAARLTFGSVDASQEQSRDERPGVGARQLIQDVRFGARLLRKAPAFGFTAVAIVALGVGAATAVFSVVYGVMLRPLPYREPERLVSIWLTRSQAKLYPSAADAAELRQLRTVYTDVALVRTANINLSLIGDGEPQRLQSGRVSPNLFSVLGVTPMLGRAFAADEDEPGRQHVVMLTEAFWRARFGADRSVVGSQIRLDGDMYTVIGVMPEEVQYPNTGLDAWIPAVLAPGELARTDLNNYRLVGRLAPHVTLDQARRETAALAKRLGGLYQWNKDAGFGLDSMLNDTIDIVRPTLNLLLGAVSLLVLIACTNLSNLFGARATARSGEFAVRLALGASRTRLVAQAVAEAAPVLAAGGVLGVVVAQWTVRAFVANAPAGLPRVESIALSAPVIAYSLALLVIAGLAASVAPAVAAWRSDFTSVTKDGGRSSTAGRGRAAARRIGVSAQIAFALPLLVGASLLLQSAIEVGRVNLGFDANHVVTAAFDVSRSKYESDQAVAAYFDRLAEAVSAVPGVASAAITNRIPLVGGQTASLNFENPTGTTGTESYVDSRTVTPDYFATLGIPMIAGRSFSNQDEASSMPVAIIDERLARAAWPGQSAVGRRFQAGDRWFTIIGVAGHVRTTGVDVDPREQVYWSTRQRPQNRAVIAVRSTLEPGALFPAVTKAIRSVNPEQSLYDLRTMNAIVNRSLAQRRLTTTLMAGFSGMALLLAAVGIYGVIAYGVTQRLREFGIRVALGATGGDVTRSVVWQGTSLAFGGAVVGLGVAIAAAGMMSHLVYGIAPRDVGSFIGATIGLLLIAGVASYIPARRAAAVDPAVTLRSE